MRPDERSAADTAGPSSQSGVRLPDRGASSPERDHLTLPPQSASSLLANSPSVEDGYGKGSLPMRPPRVTPAVMRGLETFPPIEDVVPKHYLRTADSSGGVSVEPCVLRTDSARQREFGRGFHISAPANNPLEVFQVDLRGGERTKLCEVRPGDPFVKIDGLFVVGPVGSASANGQVQYRLASLRSLSDPLRLVVASAGSEATFVVMPGSQGIGKVG